MILVLLYVLFIVALSIDIVGLLLSRGKVLGLLSVSSLSCYHSLPHPADDTFKLGHLLSCENKFPKVSYTRYLAVKDHSTEGFSVPKRVVFV